LSKVPPILVDPEKPESIVKAVTEVTRVVDGEIEFGNPQNPYDDQSTTLAGAGTPTTHNGSVQNIKGQWVEVEVSAADTATTCTHNLNQTVAVAGEPNVRWIVFGFEHDGNTADAASTLSANFETGDTITADAIELRFYVGGTRVVDGDHKLKVTLFFIPAVQ
jgi:hypothetical protein